MSRIGRLSLPALLFIVVMALSATAWAVAAPDQTAAPTPDATPAAPESATSTIPGAGLPEALRTALFPMQEPQVLQQDVAMGNPDLPLLAIALLGIPVPIVLVVDARNGKDTWNFTNDPIILVATADGRHQWIDTGILAGGKATGTFLEVDSPKEAVGLLQQLLLKKTRFF